MKKYTFTEKKDTRSGFGDGMVELGKTNPNVVALCADLVASLKLDARAVTAEEHQLNSGLGDAVCQVLSRNLPSQVEMIGVSNSFGESGTPSLLMEKYGLNAKNIVNAVER